MKKDLYEFRDYKTYLKAIIAAKPKSGRGARMALARAIGSPVSHISQVLNGNSHLSMEQAEGVNTFFGHTDDEASFFLLLLQYSRAGSVPLRKRLESQIQKNLERRFVLKDRLGVKAVLSKEDQAQFYSSWIYGAAHVMLSIDRFQTREAIGDHLGISRKRSGEVLEFLVSIGLAVPQAGGRHSIGAGRIHLGNESPMISKFHSNWRLQAIRSMEREDFKENLHYSSAVTLSEEDVSKIKSVLIKQIEEIKAVIKDSKEETVHCFSLDFFRI